MAHSEEIGRELRSISEGAAGLPAGDPFTVPSGFFQSFPEKMLDLVRALAEEEGEGDAPGFAEETAVIGESNSPEGSPQGFPADLKDRPTFQVPIGYFDNLAENILGRIKAQEESKESPEAQAAEEPMPSILVGLKDKPTFRVPTGYFDHLPEFLTDLAKTPEDSSRQEIRALSPLLSSLQGNYPGTVPEGYFAHFLEQTKEAIRHEALQRSYEEHITPVQEAPVVQMNRLFPVRKFLAAAVTIGAVLLSAVWGYHIYDRPSDFVRSGVNIKTEAQFNAALAKLSDQDIMDYLGSSTDVSDADLIASEVDNNPDEVQNLPETISGDSGGQIK